MRKVKSFVDGPYIYVEHNGLREVRINGDENGIHLKEQTLTIAAQQITCTVDNDDGDKFHFDILTHHQIPPCEYAKPSKLFVIADIEGNFNSFKSLLIGNNIIDKNFDWIFGNGHLVLLGDIVDRDLNVLPVLWLIYKLEQEARLQGGVVHFILGNHEDLFISAKTRYAHPKYLFVAKQITKVKDEAAAYAQLISEDLLLRQWLVTKNAIEIVGDLLLVHGGISQQVLDLDLTVLEINNVIREGILRKISNPTKIPTLKLLMGSYGPLWFRGFVFDYKELYKKVSDNFISKVIEYFKVEHILIGHNMVKEISPDFNRKLYRLDVKQPTEAFTGMSQALLIEHNTFYRVNDFGERIEI